MPRSNRAVYASAQVPTFSLLPPACVELFDELAPHWRDLTIESIRRSSEHEPDFSLLMRCGITTLGNLGQVSPLIVLTLFSERGVRAIGDGLVFWPSVLESINALLRVVLRDVIEHLLSAALQRAKLNDHVTGKAIDPVANLVSSNADPYSSGSQPSALEAGSLHIDFPMALLWAVSRPDSPETQRSLHILGAEVISPGLIAALDVPLLTSDVAADLSAHGCNLETSAINDLFIAARTHNTLIRHCHVRTLAELVRYSPRELLSLRQFGPGSYIDLVNGLRSVLVPWLGEAGHLIHRDGAVLSEQDASVPPLEVLEASPLEGWSTTASTMPLTVSAEEALSDAKAHTPLVSPAVLRILETSAAVRLGASIESCLAQQAASSPTLVRVMNAFHRARIGTIRDVLRMSVVELCGLRFFGDGCFRALHTFLRSYLGDLLQDAVNLSAFQAFSSSAHNCSVAITSPTSGATTSQSAHTSAIRQLGTAEYLARLLDRYSTAWRYAQIYDGNHLPSTVPCALSSLKLGDVLEQLYGSERSSALLPEETFSLSTAIATRIVALLARGVIPVTGTGPLNSGGVLENATIESLLHEMCTRVGFALPSNRLSDVGAPRELAVVFQRLGLFDGQSRTLAELGERFNVTRERVRQLERKALARLDSPEALLYHRALSSLVAVSARALGGVTTVLVASARISAQIPFGDLHPIGTVRLLAQWAPDISITQDSQLLVAAPFTADDADIVRSIADSILASYPADTPVSELVTAIQQQLNDSIISGYPGYISSIVTLLRAETSLRPREGMPHGSLTDRLVYVLRELGAPTHFSRIAERYRETYNDDQKRSDHATHAVLGRFPDVFVRVGLGTFALAEAGYNPRINNVAALLGSMLAESPGPLHVYDIVLKATEKYRWQDGSILAGLTTSSHFRSLGYGFYALSERQCEGFDPASAYLHRFGYRLPGRERLVAGIYTSVRGNFTVLIRLTAMAACGFLGFGNQAMREMFPAYGQYHAACSRFGGNAQPVQLQRVGDALEGLGPWLRSLPALPRDVILIERCDNHSNQEAPFEYRFTFAPASQADALIHALTQSDRLSDDE